MPAAREVARAPCGSGDGGSGGGGGGDPSGGGGGGWCEVVEAGARWWRLVGGGGRWWEVAGGGGRWWEAEGGGGRGDGDGGGNEGKRTGDVNEDGEVIIASSPSADNVYEEYLSDLWSIDLRTGRCSQRELLEEVGLGPARGGAIVIIPSPAEIIITPSSADIPMREEAIQPSEDKESASLTVLALGGFNETINEDTNGISTSESQFLDFRSSTIANTFFIS